MMILIQVRLQNLKSYWQSNSEPMITPDNIRNQVQKITEDLIACSLSVDQQFPSIRVNAGETRVDFGRADLSIALKNVEYQKIYDELSQLRSYNFKMIDGALVQIMYIFIDDVLRCHRLAFFPSPYLEEYQNNAEIYDLDELYADIIKKSIVPFPIRFDFDCREDVVVEVTHPHSHLTLGQYQNCRIPVSAPLTPYVFVLFILRNFYNTAFSAYSDTITPFNATFEETITNEEKRLSHFQLPIGSPL